MPDDSKPPPPLPGDIVQVIVRGRQGALAVVALIRPWGVSGYMPLARTKDYPTEDVPIRLKHNEFLVVGCARVMSNELAKARETAIATAKGVEPATPKGVVQ